jgi:nucleotide-binding universal stress UspA family protein
MTFKHILVPLDSSAASRRTARHAIDFARETGARLTAYHALPVAAGGVYGEGYRFAHSGDVRKELRQARERLLESTERAARDLGVACDALVERAAAPADAIVAAARKHKCDAIFIGTNGRRGLARLALGSVTSQVVRDAAVPVVVYR